MQAQSLQEFSESEVGVERTSNCYDFERAAGWSCRSSKIVHYCQAIGLATNNQAGYRVLIKGLELATKHTTGRVDCYSDSQLVVNQLNETWKVNKKLKPLWIRAAGMENDFDKVTYNQLRRTDSRIEAVDALANKALDGED